MRYSQYDPMFSVKYYCDIIEKDVNIVYAR